MFSFKSDLFTISNLFEPLFRIYSIRVFSILMFFCLYGNHHHIHIFNFNFLSLCCCFHSHPPIYIFFFYKIGIQSLNTHTHSQIDQFWYSEYRPTGTERVCEWVRERVYERGEYERKLSIFFWTHFVWKHPFQKNNS